MWVKEMGNVSRIGRRDRGNVALVNLQIAFVAVVAVDLL
jgi:hypothetical protein